MSEYMELSQYIENSLNKVDESVISGIMTASSYASMIVGAIAMPVSIGNDLVKSTGIKKNNQQSEEKQQMSFWQKFINLFKRKKKKDDKSQPSQEVVPNTNKDQESKSDKSESKDGKKDPATMGIQSLLGEAKKSLDNEKNEEEKKKVQKQLDVLAACTVDDNGNPIPHKDMKKRMKEVTGMSPREFSKKAGINKLSKEEMETLQKNTLEKYSKMSPEEREKAIERGKEVSKVSAENLKKSNQKIEKLDKELLKAQKKLDKAKSPKDKVKAEKKIRQIEHDINVASAFNKLRDEEIETAKTKEIEKKEEPKKEEPKKEEPKKDDTTPEKKEEPKKEEDTKTEEPKKDDNKKEDTTPEKKDDTKKEEPKKEEPKKEEDDEYEEKEEEITDKDGKKKKVKTYTGKRGGKFYYPDGKPKTPENRIYISESMSNYIKYKFENHGG